MTEAATPRCRSLRIDPARRHGNTPAHAGLDAAASDRRAAAIVVNAFTHLSPQTTPWESFWLLVALAVCWISAWLFWRLIEAPCIALARSCRPSEGAPHR